VVMFNLGSQDYTIEKGDRIAQLVVARYEPVEWEEGDLGESERGAGGFGSSGR
jgi:dUTP pyrophosphatase